MKKISGLIFATLILSVSISALAHHEMMGRWDTLPKSLNLSASQKAGYDAYVKDMHSDLKKLHEAAVAETAKVLTPSQYAQFAHDMKEMHRGMMKAHHGMMKEHHKMMFSAEAMKAMADKEADKLLLTEGQAVQFENIAAAFGKKAGARVRKFFTQLAAILTKEQRTKLSKFSQMHHQW